MFREKPMTVSFSVFITHTTDKVRSLSVDRRNCFYDDEGPPLNVCEADCAYDTAKSLCGCVPWFLAKYGNDECPVDKYSSCFNSSTILGERRDCKCMLGCDHISYLIQSISALHPDSGNSSSIKMTAWPHLR